MWNTFYCKIQLHSPLYLQRSRLEITLVARADRAKELCGFWQKHEIKMWNKWENIFRINIAQKYFRNSWLQNFASLCSVLSRFFVPHLSHKRRISRNYCSKNAVWTPRLHCEPFIRHCSHERVSIPRTDDWWACAKRSAVTKMRLLSWLQQRTSRFFQCYATM